MGGSSSSQKVIVHEELPSAPVVHSDITKEKQKLRQWDQKLAFLEDHWAEQRRHEEELRILHQRSEQRRRECLPQPIPAYTPHPAAYPAASANLPRQSVANAVQQNTRTTPVTVKSFNRSPAKPSTQPVPVAVNRYPINTKTQRTKSKQRGDSPHSTTLRPAPSDLVESKVSNQRVKAISQKKVTSAHNFNTIISNTEPKASNQLKQALSDKNVSPPFNFKWTIPEYLIQKHLIDKVVANNIWNLFETGCTVPFIIRYRQHLIPGMKWYTLRQIRDSYEEAKLIQEQARVIIDRIYKQDSSNGALINLILSMDNMEYVKIIGDIFNDTDVTLEEDTAKVLTHITGLVSKGLVVYPLISYVNRFNRGMDSEHKIKTAVVRRLATEIIREVLTIWKIKQLLEKYPMIMHVVKKNISVVQGSQKKTKNKSEYNAYHNLRSSVNDLNLAQVLMIQEGREKGALNIETVVPVEFEQAFCHHCRDLWKPVTLKSEIHSMLLNEAVDEAYKRVLMPLLKRRMMAELTKRVTAATADSIALQFAFILTIPCVRNKAVIGIDPTHKDGCKYAVVSEDGCEHETGMIYPHSPDKSEGRFEAECTLVRLVHNYRCEIFAVRSGTASQETVVFISDLIKNGAFRPFKVSFQMVRAVNDPNIDSAVTIARTLRDPMIELLRNPSKILISRGLRYSLSKATLDLILQDVIRCIVSFIGVDANTAPVHVLQYIAGLNSQIASDIVEWRKKHGNFKKRDDLKLVKGINKVVFDQCSGFIRVSSPVDGTSLNHNIEYLDQTWIHPEYYHVAKSYINASGTDICQFGTEDFLSSIDSLAKRGYAQLAQRFDTSEDVIDLVVEGLKMTKGQDVRYEGRNISVLRTGVKCLGDLSVGDKLTGVVVSIQPIGVFIDVGAEVDGFIHQSAIKPTTLYVDQRVEVQVFKIEEDKRRIALKLSSLSVCDLA